MADLAADTRIGDPTGGPSMANSEGHVYRARSEGRACRARQSGMDNPTLCSGPDKQVPPISEGRARHAR